MNKITAWISVILLIITEYFFFNHLIINKIIPNYPEGIDQANYLYAAYGLYNNIIQQGLFTALSQYHLISTSYLFIIQAALFFLLFGASRYSVLLLNFLYFTVLQLIGFYTIKKLTKRYSLGFLFIGILLSANSFFIGGGAIDFRMDFIAYCLYGMLTCFILLSQVFLNRKWVISSALLASFLIMMRFLTVAYILGMISSMIVFYTLMWLYQKRNQIYAADSQLRIKNIVLFAIIVGILVTPILWMHRQLLYSYYIVGHVTGPEKFMRAEMLGVKDIFTNLTFYPITFINYHLTANAFMEITLILLLLFGVYVSLRQADKQPNFSSHFLNEIIFLLVSIGVPLTILTIDHAKSLLVPNIVLVPVALLVVWVVGSLCQKIDYIISVQKPILTYGITSLFLITGIYHFIYVSMIWTSTHKDIFIINKMIQDIGNIATQTHFADVYATADIYTDFFAAIPAFYYETHGVLLHFECGFGCGSQTLVKDEKSAMDKIDKSNVFMSSAEKSKPNESFLFDNSIKTFQPTLKKQAMKRLSLMGAYKIDNVFYQVYVADTSLRSFVRPT